MAITTRVCDETNDEVMSLVQMWWKNLIFTKKIFWWFQIGTMAITTRVCDETSEEVMSLVENVM